MRRLGNWNETTFKFTRLVGICTTFFGSPRKSGGSHFIFKTPWIGDPRINIQKERGKAKAYQVRQVVAALRKLKAASPSPKEP
jgi:hypothetical protein